MICQTLSSIYIRFAGHSVCWTFGSLDIWLLDTQFVGKSFRWTFGSLKIRFFGHSGGWTFGSLDYGLVRPLAGCDATPIITGFLPSFIGDRDLDQGLSCLLGTQAFLQEKK